MTIFESMLEFLKEQEVEPFHVLPRVQRIIGIKLKEDDDDYGAARQHYIVRCEMLNKTIAYSEENTVTEGKLYETKCLVNAIEFDNYRQKRNKVIWL